MSTKTIYINVGMSLNFIAGHAIHYKTLYCILQKI